MPDLSEGERVEITSASNRYTLERTGEIYTCTCPAWLYQTRPVRLRTCKHLEALRGAAAEAARIGAAMLTGTEAGAEASVTRPPGVLLAQVWDNATDLRGWWRSEKLDGVRAWWDGRQFLSRQGNRFMAPAWFTEGLPDHPLDGEIWGGRQRFQHTVSVARRLDGGEGWRDLRYMVFDLPGMAAPFEQRVEELEALFRGRLLPYAQLHPQQRCGDVEDLRAELDRVCALGGEGLMLRQPGSRYEAGRSWTLLKVKKFYDAEARVVEHQPGLGKHEGRLGALLVETAEGVRFAIGTGFSDVERGNPPPVGAWVSFRYQELTDAGVPRFPSWIGVRDDLTPEQMARPLPRPAPLPAAGAPAFPAPAPRAPLRPPARYLPRRLKPQIDPAPADPAPADPAPADPAPAADLPPDPPSQRWYLRLHWLMGSAVQFWEIGVWDDNISEQYGREGREPKARTWKATGPGVDRHDAALREADHLAQSKLDKGYEP